MGERMTLNRWIIDDPSQTGITYDPDEPVTTWPPA